MVSVKCTAREDVEHRNAGVKYLSPSGSLLSVSLPGVASAPAELCGGSHLTSATSGGFSQPLLLLRKACLTST